MNTQTPTLSKGIVDFIEFPGHMANALKNCLAHFPDDIEGFINLYASNRFKKNNLIFNYPRAQYAKLDRGEVPDIINAKYFTLSNTVFADPTVETVVGETSRLATSTRAVDPFKPTNSIIRFIVDVGQFTGSWKTAILIGGADASLVAGTGKIIAAVNDVKDDNNTPLNRDGTTVHLLDSSEV